MSISPQSSDTADLHRVLTHFPNLIAHWDGNNWSWDNRFMCPTTVVEGDAREATFALMRKELTNTYDHTRVAHLPAPVAQLVQATGGLRPGQCVLTDEERSGVHRYALWWPWTNGTTVSIRIGVTS